MSSSGGFTVASLVSCVLSSSQGTFSFDLFILIAEHYGHKLSREEHHNEVYWSTAYYSPV